MLSNEVCRNYISPVGLFFNAIFRLTDLSSDAFEFLSLKLGETGSAERALSAFRVFQLCFSSNCFGDLYLWCEGWFLEVEPPTVDPPPLLPPHRAVAPTPVARIPPRQPPPPARWSVARIPPHHPPPPPAAPLVQIPPVATDEQPIGKNPQFYEFLFKLFEIFESIQP